MTKLRSRNLLRNLLVRSIRAQKVEDVKLKLQQQEYQRCVADKDNEALRVALIVKNLAIIRCLLRFKFVYENAVADRMLYFAITGGDVEIVKELLKNNDIKTKMLPFVDFFLCTAAQYGYYEIFKIFYYAKKLENRENLIALDTRIGYMFERMDCEELEFVKSSCANFRQLKSSVASGILPFFDSICSKENKHRKKIYLALTRNQSGNENLERGSSQLFALR